MNGNVMIAVDPHKASNTAAVLDPVTKTVIEAARFANSQQGYERLTGFAGRWEQRRWAVEGCRGGRSLAQRLVADGELVLDVPAKLAARVRVYSQGHGRKPTGTTPSRSGWPPWTAPALPCWARIHDRGGELLHLVVARGCQAAIWYSCVSPPRTCFRRIRYLARLISGGRVSA
jgi:hypothetical protein